jgi:branched-subunit amino acid transport protein AzlD
LAIIISKILTMLHKVLNFFRKENALQKILWGGIILRILVFIVMNPNGPDAHYEVLDFMLKNHRLPRTNELFLACHPPLYYITSVPFYVIGGLKLVEFYGLITSCLNLWLMAKLIKLTIKDVEIRNLSFLLASFLGTYLIYSLFVSNDSLSVLMGTWVFYNLIKYLRDQTQKNVIILSLSTGLALLTKSTFVPFIPVVLIIIFLVNFRKPFLKMVYTMILCGAIIGFTGTYKFVENYRWQKHKIFVHNLDIFPLTSNAIFYQGPQSYYNINILTLIKDPNLSSRNPSIHAAPLLMYGTFWYKHQYFENNLTFGNYSGFRYIGSLFFILGVLPTLLIFIGLWILIKQSFHVLFTWKQQFGTATFWERIFQATCLVLLLGSVATMFTGLVKYNDWAFMHTRLLVHVFYPIVLLLATGFSFVKQHYSNFLKYISLNLTLFAGLSFVYFSVESAVIAYNWLHYGNKDEIQWYVNKRLGL